MTPEEMKKRFGLDAGPRLLGRSYSETAVRVAAVRAAAPGLRPALELLDAVLQAVSATDPGVLEAALAELARRTSAVQAELEAAFVSSPRERHLLESVDGSHVHSGPSARCREAACLTGHLADLSPGTGWESTVHPGLFSLCRVPGCGPVAP